MDNSVSSIHCLKNLIIYRNILKDEIIAQLIQTPGTDTQNCFSLGHALLTKAEILGLSGDVLKSYLLYLLATDENVFSLTAEKTGGKIGPSLRRAVTHDLTVLQQVLTADLSGLVAEDLLRDYTPTCPAAIPGLTAFQHCLSRLGQADAENFIDGLANHYAAYGCGEMAKYIAFRYERDRGITGIANFDDIGLGDIIGYERQKDILIRNTQAFLAGRPANNVLLIGARGTGKSSSVKALINEYHPAGLRIVEVSKYDLRDLPLIMSQLRFRGKKFILFLDDLSFEENEIEYKYLKSMIDGGLSAKPANVLIYATSNRRHLIRENWTDHDDSDDLHNFDTVNEKISLSDRFGLTITYLPPNQEQYLAIVTGLAAQNNINLNPEELQSAALRWETAHSGRSGRVARQFITHLLSTGRPG